jgi:hypothetical protein
MKLLSAVLHPFFKAFETIELGGWVYHLPTRHRRRVGMTAGYIGAVASAAFCFFYLGPAWLSNGRWLTEGQGAVQFALVTCLGYGSISSVIVALESKRS